MEIVIYELLAAVFIALMVAAAGVGWAYRQSQRPSREAQLIVALQAQLNAEIDRNNKMALRSDRLSARQDELEEELEAMREAHLAELEAMREAHESDREEAAALRAEVEEMRRGIDLLIVQLKKAEIPPAWQPPEPKARRTKVTSPRPASLTARIATHFDIEEMNSLAFDVGIDHQAFGGTTLEARARELVRAAGRRGRTAALERRISELRPEIQE